MKILITGGAGYIGSITSLALLKAGYEIVILDNLINSSPDVIRRIKELSDKDFSFYAADLTQKSAVFNVFNKEKIEAVIHFAGLKAVGESVEIPLRYYSNNIVGTLNLLDVMKKYSVKHFVFSSSATVYGGGNKPPYNEDMPLAVTNPYGGTKLTIENILRDLYISDSSWRIALLRYFNPVGAHESGMLGDNPSGVPNNLMPYLQRVAVGALPKLNVFGGDYETPDGTCIRDYIHVSDLANGHIRALMYLKGNSGIEAINLGTGVGYSVLEIINAFKNASGKEIPYEITARRAGDLPVMYADTKKAERLLNWRAELSLEKMCLDSYRFAQAI